MEQSIRSRYPSVRRLYIEANPANAVGRESNSGMHPGTGVDAPGADQQRTGTEE